jgi:polyribonucleotide nucleotidyltransferase
VKSTTAFGAFVEIMPGTEGLVHISELKHGRTEKTEDVVKKGDRVKVKLLERDERGRLRLSMKALQPKPEGEASSTPRSEEGGSPFAGEGEESSEGVSEEGRSSSGGRSRRPPRSRARSEGNGGRGRSGE